MKSIYLFLFFMSCITGVFAENTKVSAPVSLSSIVHHTRLEGPVTLLGEPVPIDRPRIREALEKELLLALWNRSQVLLWMKRSTRIFPDIEKMLKKEGLPDDLKYVVVVESALRPHAGSSKGAVGYWQFIKSTALKYDLRVDACLDERRNLERSSRAACAYFKNLYETFGTWSLALAAFNMGENGLAAAIELQETHDYYDLYLSLETQRYVLKVAAVKMIFEQPETYGFFLEKGDLYPPEAREEVTFTIADRVSLPLVARAAEISFKELKILNPEIRGYFLCRGPCKIMVPRGKGKGFNQRFKTILDTWKTENHPLYHTVRKGENLTMIAGNYNVSLALLLQWNRLKFNSVIHPGKVLVVGYKK